MESENPVPILSLGSSRNASLEGVSNKSHGSEQFTIPEKVIHFLTEHMPDAYCDDCMAAALKLRRTQVNTVTSTLGLCCEYSRGAQTCKTCLKAGKSATRRDRL